MTNKIDRARRAWVNGFAVGYGAGLATGLIIALIILRALTSF
jgi:hypothetical protein